ARRRRFVIALARVPIARLVRTPRSLAFFALWTFVAIVSAVIARKGTSGADHVMRGSFGYVVVPLVAFAIVGAALGGQGLQGAGGGSLVVPRGLVAAVLGGALAADLPARASSALLFVQILLYAGLAVALTRRP